MEAMIGPLFAGTILVSMVTTTVMHLWKGWWIGDDALGFNKKPTLTLIAIASPGLFALSWAGAGFTLGLLMNMGLCVIIPAMVVEFFFIAPPKRQGPPSDDRDSLPKPPIPSEGLSPDDRRKLYDKLGPALRLKDLVE